MPSENSSNQRRDIVSNKRGLDDSFKLGNVCMVYVNSYNTVTYTALTLLHLNMCFSHYMKKKFFLPYSVGKEFY